MNRHRAKESSPNNCAKRAIKGAKNLGMELSLTFKLSVRHIVCVCVPTAQIFVKLILRKSTQLTAAILPTLSALLFHFFHFLSLLSCLLFPKKTLKCIKTKEVRARRAYQKREREREWTVHLPLLPPRLVMTILSGLAAATRVSAGRRKRKRVCKHPSCSQKRE